MLAVKLHIKININTNNAALGVRCILLTNLGCSDPSPLKSTKYILLGYRKYQHLNRVDTETPLYSFFTEGTCSQHSASINRF